MGNLRRALLFKSIIFLSLLGCALSGGIDSPKNIQGRLKEEVVGYVEERAPLEVKVLSERNDGQTLEVRVQLTALTQWSSNEIVIVISALHNGVVLSQREHCILSWCREILDPRTSSKREGSILAKGQVHDLTLSVPASELTDYRLELIWGPEAREYRARLSSSYMQRSSVGVSETVDRKELNQDENSAESPGPQLTVISTEKIISQCGANRCQVSYHIKGTLRNLGSRPLKHVTLGAGFLLTKAESDETIQKIPKKEEKISVAELYLAPNSSQTIEIVLEQEVPRAMLARLVPNLRILTHEYTP